MRPKPGARRHLVLSRDRAPWWCGLIMHEKRIMLDGAAYRAALFHAMVGGLPEDFHPPLADSAGRLATEGIAGSLWRDSSHFSLAKQDMPPEHWLNPWPVSTTT